MYIGDFSSIYARCWPVHVHSVIKQQLFISGSQRSSVSHCSRYTTSLLNFYFTIFRFLGKPIITGLEGELKEILPGENITCCAVGPPLPTVTWMRHNRKLLNATGCATLQFNSINYEDQGAYTCHAENQLGTNKKQVVVLFKTGFIERPPKNLRLKVGQNALVQCSAAAQGTFVNVSWSFVRCGSCKTQALDLGSGTLRFVSVETWHSGRYQCVAKVNGILDITASVYVDVDGGTDRLTGTVHS